MAVSADGSRIFTGSDDRTARVWELRREPKSSRLTWQTTATLEGHDGSVESLAVTPDGTRLVTGWQDNTARIWQVHSNRQALMDQAKRLAPRCLTAEQRERYQLNQASPVWCMSMQKWPYDGASVGADLLQRRKWQEAITAIDRAMSLDPSAAMRLRMRLSVVHFNRAQEAWADVFLRGKPVEVLTPALADAEKALSLIPERAEPYALRGLISLELGRIDEAFADLDKAIARGLRGAIYYNGRGRAHELKKNREAAISDYEQVLSLVELDNSSFAVEMRTRERLEALGVEVKQKP